MPEARRAARRHLGGVVLCAAQVAATATAMPLATPGPPAEAAPWLETLPVGGHVHDAGGVLSAEERGRLDGRLSAFEQQTGHAVHLLILPEMEGGFGGLDATVRAAATRWALGRDKQHAAILIVHVQNLDLLHAATELGRTVPAIEDGVGDVLSLIYRLTAAGDPDMAWRAAVEQLVSLLESGRAPPAPTPRPEAEASMAARRTGPVPESAPDAGSGGAAAPLDQATGYVIDEAGLLLPPTIRALNALLRQNEEDTSNQVVALTVATLGGEPIESVSLRRAASLGIGQKGRDNGVLLLVARDERRVRIEVGYGLEGALPDILCGRIIRDEILPRFKDGDYEGGVRDGLQAIVAATRGEYRATALQRGRDALAWLPARPAIPLVAQAIIGVFYWVFSLAWVFAGPVLFFVAGKPVRLGVLPGLLITSVVVYLFPGVLLPLGLGVVLWLDNTYGLFGRGLGRPAGSRADGRTWSSSKESCVSSGSSAGPSSSSSSTASSFSGGGGRLGGGGASGSW